MSAPEQRLILDVDAPIDRVFVAVVPISDVLSVSAHICLDDVRAVVGLDSIAVGDEEAMNEMLAAHVLRLRKIPCMSKSLFVVFLDADISFDVATTTHKMLEHDMFAPVHVTKSDRRLVVPHASVRAELWTVADHKAFLMMTIQDIFTNNKLKIANVVTGSNISRDLATLKAQLHSDESVLTALQMGIYWEKITWMRIRGGVCI
jgi:hypothetical protein